MKEEVKNYLFLRKMLGILCGLLAPCCLLFGLIGAEHNMEGWYMSISATYYASSKVCMIGLLFTASVFFLCYTGYDWRDRVMSILQALGCMGVVFFPCSVPGAPETVGIFDLPISVSHTIHMTCATVLFASFAINIFFLFTLGNVKNEKKRQRNLVYRICGIVIFAFSIILALHATPLFSWVPEWFPYTWFCEFIMLTAFSVAWLVKSESIRKLNDVELNG